MFAEVLKECLDHLSDKQRQEFYYLCMSNKYIRKRIQETEKYYTYDEIKNLKNKSRQVNKNE